MPVRHELKPGEFCWIDLVAHDLDAAGGSVTFPTSPVAEFAVLASSGASC